jgi:hypothetical protein
MLGPKLLDTVLRHGTSSGKQNECMTDFMLTPIGAALQEGYAPAAATFLTTPSNSEI